MIKRLFKKKSASASTGKASKRKRWHFFSELRRVVRSGYEPSRYYMKGKGPKSLKRDN